MTIILNNAPEESKATYVSFYFLVVGVSAFVGSSLMGLVLQLISGNQQPTLEVLTILMVGVSLMRFIFWFSFFFLKEDQNGEFS